MSAAIVDLPAHEQARRVKSGALSAVELLEATFERIQAVEGRPPTTDPYVLESVDLEKVHAFISRTQERARQQAGAVDTAIAAGEPVGPLAGVPLAVKDNFCVQGTASTAGSKILENFIAPYTATAVERLEQAGRSSSAR